MRTFTDCVRAAIIVVASTFAGLAALQIFPLFVSMIELLLAPLGLPETKEFAVYGSFLFAIVIVIWSGVQLFRLTTSGEPDST